MSEGGRLRLAGLAALIPPLLYVVGGWRRPGFGRPFMLGFLFGPESSHTTVGLVLLALGKILSPLAAIAIGWVAFRRGDRGWGPLLVVAGLTLLLLNLATRQPHV